jgi:hypothetical protein
VRLKLKEHDMEEDVIQFEPATTAAEAQRRQTALLEREPEGLAGDIEGEAIERENREAVEDYERWVERRPERVERLLERCAVALESLLVTRSRG